MTRLAGKIAIITGAAGGIGCAALKRFTAEGARVLAVDTDQSGLERVIEGVDSERASTMTADVSQSGDMARCIEAAVTHYGKLDVAVLNAGIEGVVSPISDYPEDIFERVLAVNVRGVWLGLKHSMPAMTAAGGGSIVVTSSVAGLRGSPGLCAYSASKHAVIGLMRTAALEGAKHGIRVNTVNPAPIETRMMRSIEAGRSPNDPEGARNRYARSMPMRRYGTAEEVADLMLFLASDESSYCTGSTFVVDGGRVAG